MGEIVELHQHQIAEQRLKLAARLREFQDEVLQEMVELLLGEGALDLDGGKGELKAAMFGTQVGQLVSELAAHLEFVAVELTRARQEGQT